MKNEAEKFLAKVQAAIERLEEVDEPNEEQENRLQALEDLANAVEEFIENV